MRVVATYAALWLLVATAVAVGVLVGSLLAGTVSAARSAQEPVSPALAVALGRFGQPDPKAVIPAPTVFDGAVGRITPSPAIGKRPAPEEAPPDRITLRGIATWFHSPAGVSAAGPALRAALGPGWRGTHVTVTGPAGTVRTVLGDTMAADRLIDLDAPLFVAVCGPLWRGICRAEVSW